MKIEKLISLSCLIVLSACASAPKPDVNLASTDNEITKKETPAKRTPSFRKEVKEFDI